MAIAVNASPKFLSCTLCCQEATSWVVGPCDHPVCLTCSARMRILCGQKECPVCRVQQDKVVVVDAIQPFSAISRNHCIENKKHGFVFTNPILFEKFNSIIAVRCPICGPRIVFSHIRQLQEHTRKHHGLRACDICLSNLKLFSHEHKLYTQQQLTVHRRDGDPDDPAHKGHPRCHFCDERYLDKDALFFHLKDQHFWCHICESDGRQDYYANYPELHKHFKEQHYLCVEGECRYTKLSAVFRTKLDLQAHKAKVHTNGLSKAETKLLRQVEVGFQYSREDGGDGMPPVSQRHCHSGLSSGRRYCSTKQKDDQDMELAKAISLSNGQQNSPEGKENDKKKPTPVQNQPTTTGSTNTSLASAVSCSKSALRKPPGLVAPPALTTNNVGARPTEWPDLAIRPVPLTNNAQSSDNLPPPPGLSRPPPGYAPLPNKPTQSPKHSVIEKAEVLLNNKHKFSEFKALCGSYVTGIIPAPNYHKKCTDLFGMSEWNNIGPEIARSMINKQKKEALLKLFEKVQPPSAWSAIPTHHAQTKLPKHNRKGKQPQAWKHSAKPIGTAGPLSEEEYPSLAAASSQPNPSLSLPGWNVKVSVK